jgi:hypothetical protein
MDVLEDLKTGFNRHVSFYERRPGTFQVIAPLFHEDGDMVDIFLTLPKSPGDPFRISDHGMTLMRLSYSYQVDSPTKEKVLNRILSENGVSEYQGRFYIDASKEHLYPSLLQFAQTVAKVSNMQAFKREVVQSLFYETLNDFVVSSLSSYHPQHRYLPVPDRDDLEVDWRFPVTGSRDIFLYGVKDAMKARLAVIGCLEFRAKDVPFRSVIVHDDFEAGGLSKKDKMRLTNVADKQFTSFSDFAEDAERYFALEAHSGRLQ